MLICVLLLSVWLFIRQAYLTYQDTVQYGGTDLRVRMVGSRLMASGFDPYFTKWQPGMSQYLCDPNDTYDRPINGVTITPFVLWLQLPLAHLPYATIRMLWWGIQQLLFLFVIAVCMYAYRYSVIAMVAIAGCAAVLTSHPAWLMHFERGQIYLLYAAWVAVLFAIWHRNGKYITATAGAWLALGILLRPTLILFAVPAFFHAGTGFKKIVLIGSFCLALATLLLLSNTWLLWKPYFSAMQLYINQEVHGLQFPKTAAPLRPTLIEGTTNLTHFKKIPPVNYVWSLNIYLAENGIWPGRKVYVLFGLCLSTLLVLLTYVKTRFRLGAEQVLMSGMLLYLIIEVSQPLRAPYNLVVWLPTALVAVGFSLSGYRTSFLPQAKHKQPL